MEYILKRSRRKTMAIQVYPDGSVVARAPMRTPQSTVEAFVTSHEDWICRNLERQRQYREANPEPNETELAALRERAKREIPPRVEHFSRIMGLVPTGVKITSARKRYGSCSGKNSLCFSCLLMRCPPEAVDYVVVHELAHIVHKNHGPDFYRLVETVFPDWRQRRAMLRQRRPEE